MVAVYAKAPTRVDIAGGTLDLWPIHHLLKRKATVNFGVTLDASVNITTIPGQIYAIQSFDQNVVITGSFAETIAATTLPLLSLLIETLWDPHLPAIKVETNALSPAGAGLGGSSCLGIVLAGALLRLRSEVSQIPRNLNDDTLVRLVQDAESRLIKSPTGCQDYWGALRGRVNLLDFQFGMTAVTTLSPNEISSLTSQLILCYSGKSRASAINNWEIFKRIFDGDRTLLEHFANIGSIAADCSDAIKEGQADLALKLSAEEWKIRTQLWPNITTPETRALEGAAKAAGATLARVCGAGGGGVMAIFAPTHCREATIHALKMAGGTVIEGGVADYGLEIRVVA